MKNNQFKKEIRKIIEDECKIFDFQSVYVDETKNSRKIYIFTLDWQYAGIFSFWFTDERIHLNFTNLKTLPLIQHKVKDVKVGYLDFKEVVDNIQEAFDIMAKTEG